MKKSEWVMTAVAIVMATGCAAPAFAVGEATPAPTAPAATAPALKPQTICPVMNEAINKKYFVDFEGKRIYLCCGSCVKTVKKDPARYVKELEAQGITLAKVPPQS